MSFAMVRPEWVTVAASDLAGIGSSVGAANAAAAGSTTAVLAAGADEVSAVIAGFFGTHAQEYQAISARVATYHQQFVQSLNGSAGAYAAAEAASASSLQTLMRDALNLINTPTNALLGRPLIGNGANGAPGTGQAGGPGGILWGNGGAGGSGRPGRPAVSAGGGLVRQWRNRWRGRNWSYRHAWRRGRERRYRRHGWGRRARGHGGLLFGNGGTGGAGGAGGTGGVGAKSTPKAWSVPAVRAALAASWARAARPDCLGAPVTRASAGRPAPMALPAAAVSDSARTSSTTPVCPTTRST
ncbi:PE family protein [Mycobacterium ulcerans str. Harvey]|uniref:PE family protein n=1 Tax=Mycobacterium ulcerans str. Harvey TaxID=1299332 RepID=A0ABN0QUJ4_MYCUL|nr:PE family protein [Mycobacterium ulcerans str. Harvey]